MTEKKLRRKGRDDHLGGSPKCGDIHTHTLSPRETGTLRGLPTLHGRSRKSRLGQDLLSACVYPVEKNLVVRTRSEKVDRIRKMILELLLAHAPDAFILQDLAKEYGADKNRFEKEASFCIHCGLCVRYCAEVKKKNAVGFVDRGIRKEISFIPEIASKECWNCKECFPLCPTEALQAAFVLTKALSSPPPSSFEPEEKK